MKEKRTNNVIEEANSVFMRSLKEGINKENLTALLERYFFLIKKAAYLGDAEGQYLLAVLYQDEERLKILRPNGSETINQERAFYWYKKSCSNNHPYACHNLASFYGTRNVVRKSKKKEFALYMKAFNLGLSEAGYAIAIGFKQEGNQVDAIEWFKKVIKISPDDGEAILELAKFYFNGLGIKKSYKYAYELFLKAANSTYITSYSKEEAIFYIGKMYFYGYYVPQSIPIAKYLIKIANKDCDHSEISEFYQHNENILKSVRAKKVLLQITNSVPHGAK